MDRDEQKCPGCARVFALPGEERAWLAHRERHPSHLDTHWRIPSVVLRMTAWPGDEPPHTDVARLRNAGREPRERLEAAQRLVSRWGKREGDTGLVTALLLAEAALTIREVIQFSLLLLVAGNETTTNRIGNAVTALLDHSGELARVVADPSLVPAPIEETLRWDAPVQIVFRTATQDVEIAGTRIPKGAYVAPLAALSSVDLIRPAHG